MSYCGTKEIKELFELTSECKGLSLIHLASYWCESFEIVEVKRNIFLALFLCAAELHRRRA